jgi:hypothetical protein
MLQDSIRSLKLDRRLRNRRGWVSEEELGRALEQLPDVKEKAAEPAPPPVAEAPPNS